MKWQQFVPLIMVALGVAVALVWRSSGKKTGGGGCQCGCAHEPDAESKKPDAVR